VAATLWALARRHWAGYWGAWFFVILAPTSTIVVIADPAFEHRMYLPLAAVVVLVVIATHRALAWAQQRLGATQAICRGLEVGLMSAAIAALAVATAQRNGDYRSELAIWADTVAKRPANPRARLNLGVAFARLGKFDEAIEQYNEALRRNARVPLTYRSLGGALASQGNLEAAVAQYTEALRLDADDAEALSSLGAVLSRQGKFRDAIPHLTRAIELNPDNATAHNNLGAAVGREGRLDEAIRHFAEALRLRPGYAEARDNLRKAQALQQRSRPAP